MFGWVSWCVWQVKRSCFMSRSTCHRRTFKRKVWLRSSMQWKWRTTRVLGSRRDCCVMSGLTAATRLKKSSHPISSKEVTASHLYIYSDHCFTFVPLQWSLFHIYTSTVITVSHLYIYSGHCFTFVHLQRSLFHICTLQTFRGHGWHDSLVVSVLNQRPWGCGRSHTLHPGPGLTQPSILSRLVNEYRLWLGRCKAGMCDAGALHVPQSPCYGIVYLGTL